jgi:hypothetical protein
MIDHLPPDAPARFALGILESGVTLTPYERRFVRDMAKCWLAESLSDAQRGWLADLARRACIAIAIERTPAQADPATEEAPR